MYLSKENIQHSISLYNIIKKQLTKDHHQGTYNGFADMVMTFEKINIHIWGIRLLYSLEFVT